MECGKNVAKTVAVTLGVAALVALAGGLAVMYSGVVNIAATRPHFALTKWVLETAMETSVERHSAGIAVPSFGERDVEVGFRRYDRVCVTCHGAPGILPSAIGKGLRPEPPDLAKVTDLSDAERYWVVKNGIRMTGMPAFGPSYIESELWGLVAFLGRLPSLTPQQYRDLQAREGGK